MVLTKSNMKLWLIGKLFQNMDLVKCFEIENYYARKIYFNVKLYDDMITAIGVISTNKGLNSLAYNTTPHNYQSIEIENGFVKIIVALEHE